MADKCWCETAKEDIEKAYKNPNPYHGALQDIMDAEIEYAKMCAICPCRKRRLERGEAQVEPEKQRKEVESEEQQSDGPAADNKEAEEEDEESKSEVSLLITEFDSDEELEENDPRDVEEERETVEGWVTGPEPPECCCAEPLAAIKQVFQEWFAYNAERKAILETQRKAYKVARANCMTHRYLHFIFISWNFSLF